MGLLGVSIITCAVLYGLLAAILVVVFMIVEVPIWISFAIVVAVIVIQFLIAPWITDLTQKWFYKTDFNASIPPYLKKFIAETCEQNGIKYPKIGIIADGAPNAFTYGRTKSDARIVLTSGLLQMLDRTDEIIVHDQFLDTHLCDDIQPAGAGDIVNPHHLGKDAGTCCL